MTTKTAEPWYVDGQRTIKAARIADCLNRLGVTAAHAVEFDQKDRRMAEKAAGITNRGSNETWLRVIKMLAGSAQPDALCPFCGHGNPLGGIGPPLPYNHSGECNQ